jgi:metal-responsive CopG/Arc/MetJ family transcriptional regulator
MGKKPQGPSLRLELGEPLATQLHEFCEKNYRKKTEVIREALTAYFEDWAVKQEERGRGKT